MKPNPTTLKWLFLLAIVVATDGCHQYDNFTTYFNTYYNSQRLISESEDEFEFQEEKKRINPRVFVPEPNIQFPGIAKETGTPPFLKEFIIDEAKMKPVETKLDSIEIKGSKILARHPKSDYIEKTLYLMAKAYFYRNSWLPSQIKCSELIDMFPAGDLSPDAHLLLSEDMLIQRKFHAGKIMLSRTVDIAWQKNRYDILSEAFRFQAELALYENDMEGAIRPYKQAIAQANDESVRAKWQIDMASLLYRMGRFKESERAFARALDYSPDYVGQFEALLYQAQSLTRLGRYKEAGSILSKLENDGKFEEWIPYVVAARMNIYRLEKNDKEFAATEKYADSAYLNNPAVLAVYFEKGMDNFQAHDYNGARKYFARSRNVRTPVFETSQQMFYLLNSWSQKLNDISQYRKKLCTMPFRKG
jgi:tetratricopeptide (TPR) repeat protein